MGRHQHIAAFKVMQLAPGASVVKSEWVTSIKGDTSKDATTSRAEEKRKEQRRLRRNSRKRRDVGFWIPSEEKMLRKSVDNLEQWVLTTEFTTGG